MDVKMEPLLTGLRFPEGPRWREGRLWFSDMQARRVMTVDLEGRSEQVVEVPGQPSGLGWTPDGELLVVSMTDRRLLRLEAGDLVEVANLASLASFHCNDMVVDDQGRAYIGNFGFDFSGKAKFAKAELILVEADGRARIVADELSFPNGSVITPDGRTLIVGETFASRLTAFEIESGGSLRGRRQWAKLAGAVPDGICLDAEGAVWVASPVSNEVLRVREGGDVLERIATSQAAVACMLGGAERRTLFVLSAAGTDSEMLSGAPTGRIEAVEVPVPGAGLP